MPTQRNFDIRQHGFVETLIAVLVLAVGLVGLYFYYQNTPHQKPKAPSVETSEPTPAATQEQAASDSGAICTQDAKKCWDGSYVGRTGPKCEFALCPPQPSPKIDPRTCDENGENCRLGY